MGEELSASWHTEDLLRPPQYIDEVEALLQSPFFSDEARANALYEDFYSLQPADIAPRAIAYVKGLRILADARIRERQHRKVHAADAPAWNDAWPGTLTPTRIKRIGAAFETELYQAIDVLCDVEDMENADQAVPQGDEIRSDELYAYQKPYVQDTLALLQQEPARVTYIDQGGQVAHTNIRGVTVIGPTGIGKSAIMGELARQLGIGNPVTSTHTRRLLLVVPTKPLKNQIAGRVGDKTFTRFAPKDASISVYEGQATGLHGDIIITTNKFYTKGYREGCFFGKRIDYTFFDEGHHLTAPQMHATLLNEGNGQPVVAFTGTPDYDQTKDVRGILPYSVNYMNILQSIENNLVNQAQLFSVNVDCSDIARSQYDIVALRHLYRHRRNQKIQEFLAPLLAQGRRAMVFCDQGNKAYYAKHMATLLTGLPGPDGKPVVAKAIHAYSKSEDESTESVLKQYHEGEIQALTTVQTGTESLNADIDVVVVGDVYSLLKLRQIIGRGIRRSDKYKITIFAQFITPSASGAGKLPYNLFEAFGLEKVEQGMVIGGRGPKSTSGSQGVDPSIFSSEIQVGMSALEGKIITQATTGQQRVVPPDYISFNDLPIPVGMNPRNAKRRLDIAGFKWVGRYDEGKWLRYYEPEAALYDFMADRNMVGRAELLVRYNIGDYLLRRVLRSAPVETELYRGAKCVKRTDLPLLDRYVNDEVPVRRPGDISFPALAKEVGMADSALNAYAAQHFGITARVRRSSRPEDDKGTSLAITKAEADMLRSELGNIAAESDRTKRQVREELGINEPLFSESLTEEEVSWLAAKRVLDTSGNYRPLEVWSERQAARIKQRLRQSLTTVLPPHMMPGVGLQELFVVGHRYVTNTAKQQLGSFGQIERLKLGFGGRSHYPCVSWGILRELEKKFKLKAGAFKIDYSRLPLGPEDSDPDHIAYARYVQVQLMPPDKRNLLGFDPSPYLNE